MNYDVMRDEMLAACLLDFSVCFFVLLWRESVGEVLVFGSVFLFFSGLNGKETDDEM